MRVIKDGKKTVYICKPEPEPEKKKPGRPKRSEPEKTTEDIEITIPEVDEDGR